MIEVTLKTMEENIQKVLTLCITEIVTVVF